ncbi:hypothetical protein [Allokutzneria oryzae]|uniref:Uncharacterized protein n=1 Tax=Allokutzneria oryzae TaxID=1378989 RepID=A0ABV6A294_9PSEU
MIVTDGDIKRPSERGVDWSAQCTDAYGQSSDFGVIRTPDGIVLVAPPGGSGLFDFGELCELISRLTQDAGGMLPTAPKTSEDDFQ